MATKVRFGVILGVAFMGAVYVPAFACGDKVSALGSGVPFERVSMVRVTGNVILVGTAGNAGDGAIDQQRLIRALERAGHDVRVVRSDSELATALLQKAADVVLSDNNPSPQPVATQLATSCVIRSLNRSAGNVLRSVDEVIAKRKSSADYRCAASVNRGI
jgi:nucleoside-diphosphate-sugar epimerase